MAAKMVTERMGIDGEGMVID